MLAGLLSDLASWAGWVWVPIEPRGVGGQITLRQLHLMDSSRYKLSQSHEGVWGKGGGVPVVRGSRIVGVPVLGEHVPNTGPKGSVGFCHEVWWGDVCSG